MTNNLENSDILELVDRYNYLIKQYVELSVEVAAKLDKFGKYRNELQILSTEFVRRGFKIEDPESLNALVASELAKRSQKGNGEV
jgi:hypothetical protein